MSQPKCPPSSPSTYAKTTAREVFEERSALIGIASTYLAVLSQQREVLSNDHNVTYEDIENDIKVITNAIDGFRDIVGEYLDCMAYGSDQREFVRKVQGLNSELEEALHWAS